MNQAVSAPTAGDVIADCFGTLSAASATDPRCAAAIRRNPATGGLDGSPDTTPGLLQLSSNLGRLATDGIDLMMNYRRDLGFAKLALSFNGNYTFNSKFKATPTAVNRECTGLYSINCSFTGSLQPKFAWTQRTTLSFEDIDVSLLWRHIDGMREEPGTGAFSGTLGFGDLNGRVVNFGQIPAYDYFDLSARFSLTDNLALTLVAMNLFDRQPPVVGSTVGSTAFNSGNTFPSTYDPLGRRFSAQVRLKF